MSRVTIRDLSRLMIATYFIGLGFGIFHGPEVVRVFNLLGAGPLASLLASASVVALASLIFLDIRRGLAVAVLGFLIFFASYAGLVSEIGRSSVESFWRDMSIIGLLLLVLVRPVSKSDRVQRARAAPTPATERNDAPDPAMATKRPPHPRRVRTEIFRQDFDAARAP